MKIYTSIILIVCFHAHNICSQSKIDSSLIRSIEKQIPKKEKRLNRLLNSGEISHPIVVSYQLDEYRITEYLKRKIEWDPSTSVYISELLLAEKRFQILLSKYYTILASQLTEKDEEILEEGQERWQDYKRYEQEVNKMINPEAYNLESIPMENLAERHLDITKFRVTEIVDYISRLKKE